MQPASIQSSKDASHATLEAIKTNPGKLEFNEFSGMWFYTFTPNKWGRRKVGQGYTPELAVEDAMKQ